MFGGVKTSEHFLGACGKEVPSVGEPDATAYALEQTCSGFGLEPGQMLAHGWLGVVEGFGGLGDRSVSGDGGQDPQSSDVEHAPNISDSYEYPSELPLDVCFVVVKDGLMTVTTTEPAFADVVHAAERLASDLPPTPMWNYPALDAVAGATVFVKHENSQPTGAFKVRGGLNYFASLPEADRSRGVVTYSTGNHAQSIAYAASRVGATCVIAMPEGTNSIKVRAVEALGASVEMHGDTLGDARKHAEALAGERGLRLISPGDEPSLITGVGTLYHEMLTSGHGIDALVVPVGSGSGAAAACLVAEGLDSAVEVIGVQSSGSPTAHDSWHARELVQRPNTTAVEGLATGSAFELPQRIMWRRMADFLLVSDEQIAQARRAYATHAHTLAEGSGAAALAAVFADDRFRGRRVGVVCSGGNASLQEIATLAEAA